MNVEKQRQSPFRFKSNSAIQSIGVILREEPFCFMSIPKILALLYLAERETLRQSGYMFIGGKIIKTPRGPVLSEVKDLISGIHFDTAEFDKYFHKDRFYLKLNTSPGVGELSPFNIKMLHNMIKRYRDHDEWDIANELNKLPEADTTTIEDVIPIAFILKELEFSNDEIENTIQEAISQANMDRFFQSNGAMR